jgi:hypothetical protein
VNLSSTDIILNGLGIQDSGGITVLRKILSEFILSDKYRIHLFITKHLNTESIKDEFQQNDSIIIRVIPNHGFIYRILFEHGYFFKYSIKYRVPIIYNVTGTAQLFSRCKQLTKVQNSLFFSKRLDKEYWKTRHYIDWLKQVYFKRLVFRSMLKSVQYIEIQSPHVKDKIANYMSLKGKRIFVKSDIDIATPNVISPKIYTPNSMKTILFVVGPHFALLHKNIKDFSDAMTLLMKTELNFEIKITLLEDDMKRSTAWSDKLNPITKFLGYLSHSEILNLFQDNSLLVSTSIVETLGLHVIEATLNGIMVVVPDETYCMEVYGDSTPTYELFDASSLAAKIEKLFGDKSENISAGITVNQQYLINSEKRKWGSIVNIMNDMNKDMSHV